MPPRRATRTASSRLFDGSSEAGGPVSPMRNAVTVRGMSPGPAKYSSAYGSPPTVMPTRQNAARQRYNLTSALSHVIDAVDDDNENDARERAEREAEELRRLQLGTRGSVPPPAVVAPVRAPVEGPEPAAAAAHSPAPGTPEPAPSDSASEPGPEAAPSVTDNSVDLVAVPGTQTPEQTPAHDFAEEDSVFAQARIFTPILPSRTGVMARTSNALQSLLHSARRLALRRDEADDEAVRQAYPHLHFIRPRSDQSPTEKTIGVDPTLQEPPAESPAPPAVSIQPTPSRLTRMLRARIATPGPNMRTRKSASREPQDEGSDELAGAETESVVSARTNLARRRLARKPSEPAEQPATAREAAPAPDPTPAKATGPPTLGSPLGTVWRVTQAMAMAITLLVLGALAVRVVVLTTASPDLYEGYRVDNRLHWYGRDWRNNLRQLVPAVLLHPLGALSDDEFVRMNGLLASHANEVAQLRRTQGLQGDAVARLGRILPAVVHMELDARGRPVVAAGFWHALKDAMQADRYIFTLLQRPDGALAVSDLQWTALQHQLEASGLLPDPQAASKALSIGDVEAIAETTLAKSWEAWLRQNEDKVRAVLGRDEEAQLSVDMVEQLSERQLARLAQRMAATGAAREVIVTRQEFLQLLQSGWVEHRVEIKGELAELEARVLALAREAAAAVAAATPLHGGGSKATSSPADSLSRREVTQLVNQLVRKGISDAQLEAMARGKIRAEWHDSLVHQVNFFSRNAGATFNHHFSSPSFQPALPSSWKRLFGSGGGDGAGGSGGSGSGSEDAMAGRLVPGSSRGSAVFDPWEQDGDCWCASVGAKPAAVAVKLGLRIVPQHLVVEHIAPGATLDPGATPKDLEVWAQITDYAQQRPLQDWSLARFPETDERDPLFGWGFVQVGAFAYERSPGGVQVFRLPPELGTLDAVTDHVIVRARTNYGAADHTCFYRLRLYGDVRPDVVG